MSNFQELKKFRGQPWSAWTDYIGYKIPPELCEEHIDNNYNSNKESQTMLLSRNDIPIFGHCPTAEVFELAVCNYCGDKFKIPALLEHIRNRHQDGQVMVTNQDTTSDITLKSNNDESPRNKSSRKATTSQRYATKKLHKEKVKSRMVGSGKPCVPASAATAVLANGKCCDGPSPVPGGQVAAQLLQVQVQLDRTKIGCNDKVTAVTGKDVTTTHHDVTLVPPSAKLDHHKLKHIRVKLKKKQEDKSGHDVQSKDGNVIAVAATDTKRTVPIRLAQSQCLAELSALSAISARVNASNEQIKLNQLTGSQVGHNNSPVNSHNKLKDGTKEITEHAQRKVSSRQAATNSTFNDLSDDSKQEKCYTSVHQSNQRKVSSQIASSKEERKRNQSHKLSERRVNTVGGVRDRTYNPDKHCGVIIKECSKPCTRSLTCKTHSINLRRAVKGRSKSFDVLLADHRKDKELARTSNNTTVNLISAMQLKKSIPTASVETKVDFAEDEITKVSRSSSSSTNSSNTKVTNSFAGAAHILQPYPQLLSLPVSIKPQNFESQNTTKLQSKQLTLPVSESDCSNFNSVSFSSASTVPFNINNQVKSNSLINIDVTKTGEKQSERNGQFDGYQQWHPLWRRNRGLLYSSLSQTPRLPRNDVSTNENNSWNYVPADTMQLTPPPPSCLIQAVQQCTKALLAASTTTRSTVNVPLSATTCTSPPLVSMDHTTAVSKRSSPTNADNYVVLKKIKTPNGQISVWGPLNTTESLQSTQGRSVVQLSINSIIGKNIIPASSVQSHQIVSTLPGSARTIKLLPSPVSIGTSRIHYITASGPIPLALQQVAIVPQLM